LRENNLIEAVQTERDAEMVVDPIPQPYKTGYVTLVGRPNVGKSTLINTLLSQKVAAVSPKPQTTRKRQLGILTLENAQIIFQDAPGIHQPRHKLGQFMLQEAIDALKDADVLLFMVDASQPPCEDDEQAAAELRERPQPTFLVLNKIDLLSKKQSLKGVISRYQADYQKLLPQAKVMAVSALQYNSLAQLLAEIINILPEHPAFFEDEQLTDWYERDIAAELLREASLNCLRDEVPHGIAVRIDEYTERSERGAFIAATLFCERESQKAIIIGKHGEMLKQIGSEARHEIEAMSGRKVFLEIRVKTQKNWRNNVKSLKSFGYPIPKFTKIK